MLSQLHGPMQSLIVTDCVLNSRAAPIVWHSGWLQVHWRVVNLISSDSVVPVASCVTAYSEYSFRFSIGMSSVGALFVSGIHVLILCGTFFILAFYVPFFYYRPVIFLIIIVFSAYAFVIFILLIISYMILILGCFWYFYRRALNLNITFKHTLIESVRNQILLNKNIFLKYYRHIN